MYKSKLNTFDLNKKRVFLRADLNVPIKDNVILNDFRLKEILNTIKLIQSKGGKIILATHIGRPNGYDATLSTKILVNWFQQKGLKIDFEPDLNKIYEESFKNPDHILLLENLRFFEGETKNDKEFAKQLAKSADYYVNDAFGTIHRENASITSLPLEFSENHRTFGPLIEKELNALENLKNPQKPFLIIIGGAKIKDKITILEHLVEKTDDIALCPAIVFTFLKSNNYEIGRSLVDENLFDICRSIEKKAKEQNINIVFPVDYQVAKDNINGQLSIIDFDNFAKDDFGISIGPKTAKLFEDLINKSKTIFFNGLPGDINRKETLVGAKAIFDAMSKSNAYTIIGGGDSVAAAIQLGFENKIDHLSTGGGAILGLLEKKILPGLKPYFN